MPDLFIMNFNEGYLLPFQSIHIPITVKHSDGENVEYIKTDISIELAETENRHTSESVHQFWNSFHGLTSRRTIPCNIAFGQTINLQNKSYAEINFNEINFKKKINDSKLQSIPVNDTNPSFIMTSVAQKILPPKGRLMTLMMKNVSKDEKLTAEEVEELKSVRSLMSKDQWSEWLKCAREERKKKQVRETIDLMLNTPSAKEEEMERSINLINRNIKSIESSLSSALKKVDSLGVTDVNSFSKDYQIKESREKESHVKESHVKESQAKESRTNESQAVGAISLSFATPSKSSNSTVRSLSLKSLINQGSDAQTIDEAYPSPEQSRSIAKEVIRKGNISSEQKVKKRISGIKAGLMTTNSRLAAEETKSADPIASSPLVNPSALLGVPNTLNIVRTLEDHSGSKERRPDGFDPFRGGDAKPLIVGSNILTASHKIANMQSTKTSSNLSPNTVDSDYSVGEGVNTQPQPSQENFRQDAIEAYHPPTVSKDTDFMLSLKVTNTPKRSDGDERANRVSSAPRLRPTAPSQLSLTSGVGNSLIHEPFRFEVKPVMKAPVSWDSTSSVHNHPSTFSERMHSVGPSATAEVVSNLPKTSDRSRIMASPNAFEVQKPRAHSIAASSENDVKVQTFVASSEIKSSYEIKSAEDNESYASKESIHSLKSEQKRFALSDTSSVVDEYAPHSTIKFVDYVSNSNVRVTDRTKDESPSNKEKPSVDVLKRQVDTFQPSTKSSSQTAGPDTSSIAMVSSSRIESAFAAAQFLKSLLETNIENGTHGSESSQSVLAIVENMLGSLEKSKSALQPLLDNTAVGDTSSNYKPKSDTVSDIAPQKIIKNEMMSRNGHVLANASLSHEKNRYASSEVSSSNFTDIYPDEQEASRPPYGTPSHKTAYTQQYASNNSQQPQPQTRPLVTMPFVGQNSSMKSYNNRDNDSTRYDDNMSYSGAQGGADFSPNSTAPYANFSHSMRSQNNLLHDTSILSRIALDNENIVSRSVHNVRRARGMPRVLRVCVSIGPVLKQSHEENPIRIDLENKTVDVVWREHKPLQSGKSHSDHSVCTLRRERFTFDHLCGGVEAAQRFSTLLRKRTRHSLLSGRGIVYVCLSAGTSATITTTKLEPPLAAILGESGGNGMMSMIIDEIFRVKCEHTQPQPAKQTLHHLYNPGDVPVAKASNAAADSLREHITLSASVFSDGLIVDLFGSSSRPSNNPIKAASTKKSPSCTIGRRSDGRYYLSNSSRLQLKSLADFERVAGVLLGRRSVMQEITQMLQRSAMYDETVTYGDLFLPETPWLLIPDTEACVLFTITTTREGLSSSSNSEVAFHFVCPLGDYWALPGTEICLLAECISGLPNYPPPSLFHAGKLIQLLVDQNAPEMDYVTVASLNNIRSSETRSTANNSSDDQCVQNSLHSLRVISQLTSM